MDGVTGIHFHQQTEAALIEAVQKLESGAVTFDATTIRTHAAKFDMPHFRQQLLEFIKMKTGLEP